MCNNGIAGELFDAEKQCRRVRTGPEEACGAPWEAPCFDRGRCRTSATGGGGKSSGGGFFLSVYVHDETCSMKRSSEIVTSYRGVAVPLLWNEAAKAVRHIAAERYRPCQGGREKGGRQPRNFQAELASEEEQRPSSEEKAQRASTEHIQPVKRA